MDYLHEHSATPDSFVSRLFERLREIPDIEWDEAEAPFHSSYDDWIAFGVLTTPPQSSSRRSTPTSSINLSPSLNSNSSNNDRTPTINYAPHEEPHTGRRSIAARVSRHVLRLEREYQLSETVLVETDPKRQHHVHPIQALRLRPRHAGEVALLVVIVESPGRNHLRDIISFGPNFYTALNVPDRRKSEVNGISERPSSQPGQFPINDFLSFAIGATECLDMLHQGNRMVHGEIRGDAFHWNLATGKVKLTNFGSGVRSFEHGLTSAGWSTLSKEHGVEYKLQFIAPEQTGRLPAAPDSRTDIYSLGILFWVMLMGERPFRGDTPLHIMQNVLGRRVPSVTSKRLDVPDALAAVIQKMLQKNIEDRYHSARGLKYDLCKIQTLLSEGECSALDNFQIGRKDANCFFTLPNTQVGRDAEYEKVIGIIQRVAEHQDKKIPSIRSQTIRSTNSSISGSREDFGAQADDRRSQNTGMDSTGSPSSVVHLMTTTRTNESKDSIPEGFEMSSQYATWPSYNPSRRLSIDNVTSTGSDLGTQITSALTFSDRGGSILRNNQKYNRKVKTEVITISGVTGLGKSCLVHSVQGEARKYGYFASAKFDQMKKTPFEAILKVMSTLFRQIFSETDVSTEFHHNLRSFVRPVWPFLHKMLELPAWLLTAGLNRASTTVGVSGSEYRPESDHELAKRKQNNIMCGAKGHSTADFLDSGSSSKSSRFMAIFLDVLRFMSSNKVILFCLDDLQFADDESLSLLQSILLARIPMVLIATYREKHLLPTKVQSLLESDAANVTIVDLLPLTEDYVAEYVAATIQRSTEYVLPLVAVIQEKTRGNPFFMREMLDTCYRQNCIWFSWADTAWTYDLDKVFTLFESDEYGSSINNTFVVKRLQELAPNTRLFIAWASLLGSTFSFRMVKSLMSGGNDKRHHSDHRGKVHLLRQTSRDAIQGLHGAISAYIIMPGEDDDQFRFCHDRYVQAAKSLEERQDEPAMHFQVAEAMMNQQFIDESSIYVKSAHICAAVDLIKKLVPFRASYRDTLFRAAERATESGGRAAALTYFENAVTLLQDDPWDESKPDVNYQETLNLFTRAAECYWFQDVEDKALHLLHLTFQKARDPSDKASSWILKSRVLVRRGDVRGAFMMLKSCLTELGVEIPDTSWEDCDKRYHELHQELLVTDHSALLQRPITTCRLYRATGAVICELMGGAYWTNPLLYYKMTLVEVELNLHRGSVTQAGLAYVHLATIAIARFNMIQFGVDMGNFAEQWFQKFAFDSYSAGRGRASHSMLVGHVGMHLRDTLPGLESAMETSLSAGDRNSSILAISFVGSIRIWASHDLEDVEGFCSYAAEELIDWQKDVRGGILIISMRQYCRALQGKTFNDSPNTIFSDQEHNQEEYLQYVEENAINPERARGSYSSHLIIALYLFGYIEEAITAAERTVKLSEQLWSARQRLSNEFFLSLAYAARLREFPNHPDKDDILRRIETYRDNIIAWTTVTDVNYGAWSSLLNSELAELRGNYGEAVRWCESALDHAEVHGFVFEHALGQELYAEHAIHRGVKRAAKNFLVEAISAYRKISAFGKARQLSEKYEWLLHGTLCLATTDVGCQTVEFVDRHGPLHHHHDDLKQDVTTYNAPVAKQNDEIQGHGLQVLGLDMIDLTSILRSSQVLSSELKLDRLLDKMTGIIVESTGAELCAIVTGDEQNGWTVGAVVHVDEPDREYPIGQSLDCVEDLVGKQVTLYCLRFKETVFVHNVLDDDRFSNVPKSYLETYPEGQAIIACPVLHGDDFILGCVYIQGPPHCFTERNLTVLRLLVNSISISITNAKLFAKVEKVSASNVVMIESQKQALAKARRAEAAAKVAEAEAIRNMKLKEEAAKAKSMFLANISHELRTPLNGVIGMSELLKDSKLDQEQKEYANSIHVCADTLLTVINDILDFSKLEAGKMQIFSVPLRLTQTIGEVVRALSYANKEKQLDTIMQLDIVDEPLVMGDPVRLHQILMNLLSNAYKFTSHGSLTVKATVDKEDLDTITMTCSVIDTGVGITDEQKKKLFLPFSQADSSTARSFGGTGLGLSICKAIIENVMKGKIWLESTPGVGTNVSFSLTFQKAPPEEDEDRPHERQPSRDPMAIFTPPPGDSPPPPNLSIVDISSIPREKLRICIAEDNPINQKIALTYVKKLGFQCEAFGDGRQAVNALDRARKAGNAFHVVLMDVQMPVLDGYNATREIRKHADPAVRDVLVIAMTASAIRGDREKCIEAGMNDYLAKPVRANVLKQMLENYWIHGGRSTPALTVTPPNGDEQKMTDKEPANGMQTAASNPRDGQVRVVA